MCNDQKPVKPEPCKRLCNEARANVEAGDFSNWMQDMLHNDTPLSEVSLPGSHNSASFAIGPPRLSAIVMASRCQAQDFSAQLRMGIRFFDLRVRPDGMLCHGVIACGNLALRDALGVCSAFLRVHPGEVIVARIKDEVGSQNSAIAIDNMVHSFVNMFPVFVEPRLPQVGEVRGRVVVLREWALPEGANRFGILWGGKLMQIQDEYRHSNDHEKWRVVQKCLGRVKPSSACLQINFTSATSLPSKTPLRLARKLNPRLAAHLRSSLPAFVGIIAMDFPSASLCELIVARNQHSRDPCRPLVLSTPPHSKATSLPVVTCDASETLQNELVIGAFRAAENNMAKGDAQWLAHLLVWLATERALVSTHDSAVVEPSLVGPRIVSTHDSAVVEPSLLGPRTLETVNQIDSEQMSKCIVSAIASPAVDCASASTIHQEEEILSEFTSLDSFVPTVAVATGNDRAAKLYRSKVKPAARGRLRCLGTKMFARCSRV